MATILHDFLLVFHPLSNYLHLVQTQNSAPSTNNIKFVADNSLRASLHLSSDQNQHSPKKSLGVVHYQPQTATISSVVGIVSEIVDE